MPFLSYYYIMCETAKEEIYLVDLAAKEIHFLERITEIVQCLKHFLFWAIYSFAFYVITIFLVLKEVQKIYLETMRRYHSHYF